MPSPIIQVRTLGAAEIEVGAVQIRPNAPVRFAALLYLSAEAGRRIPRRLLIELMFPDKSERNGLHSLRELIYQLRAAGVPLVSDHDAVELPCWAVQRDYAVALGAQLLTREQIVAAQGGILPGYSPDHSEAYIEWFDRFQAKTSFALSQVLLRHQAHARDVGNLELSEAAARACLAISPLNENAVLALAESIALGGAKADAERMLDDYATEVGIRSPELRLSAQLLKRRISERLPGQYRRSGDLTFAGRETEMVELQRRFASSRTGLTERAIVVGEPGIGKTRLVSEFAALAALDNTMVERVTALPQDRARPMGILIDLVPALIQLRGALGITPESMESLRRLTTTSGADSLSQSLTIEPEVLSHTISHALDDLLSAITAETHLTIIVEDAHWADALSLRVLGELATRRDQRLFLALTSRERVLHDLGDRFMEEASIVTLRPLNPNVSREVLKRALHGSTGEQHCQLHEWMADVASGNPFFMSLLVTHFLATAEPFVVPPSLQDLLDKRLESLDPADSVILQTCVLLGSMATLPRLMASLDLECVSAVAAVARLDVLRMIRSIDGKLIPVHSLLADALVRRSSTIGLTLLHRRIALVLETELGTAESATTLWNCAEHWAAAGEHERAFSLLRKCADHARDIGRPGAAAEILLRVASMHIDADTRIGALQEAIRLAKAGYENDLVLLGISHLRQIDPSSHHDDIELAELHALSVTHRDSSDYERRVLVYLQGGCATADYRVRAGLAALQYADNHARPELASRVAAAVSNEDLAAAEPILALEYQLVFHAAFGDAQRSAEIARKLQLLADDISGARGVSLRFNAVIALLHAGAVDEAFAGCERAYEFGKNCGAIKLQLSAAVQLAVILYDQGRLAESLVWRQRTQALLEAHSRLLDGFEAYVHEIDFCLLEGDVARAQVLFRRCEDLRLFTSPVRQRWHRSLACRLRQVANGPSLSSEEIAELMREGNDSIPPTGIRDLEIVVICAAFVGRGNPAAARAILHDFLDYRAQKTRAPIPIHLRHAIAMYALE